MAMTFLPHPAPLHPISLPFLNFSSQPPELRTLKPFNTRLIAAPLLLKNPHPRSRALEPHSQAVTSGNSWLLFAK
jgi:hypothetical protein